MMPSKRRPTEKGEPAQKRFRQSTLDFHFSNEKKTVRQVENKITEECLEDNMSLDDDPEIRKRRELLAQAAERRKEGQSPGSTPPHDHQDSSLDSTKNIEGTGSTNSRTKDTINEDAFTQLESKNVSKLGELRTTEAPQSAAVGYSGKQTEQYDKVIASATKEFGITEDDREKPSTSRGGPSRRGGDAQGIVELGLEEGEEEAELNSSQPEPDMSPTLEYDGSQSLFTDTDPTLEEELEIAASKNDSQTYWKGTPISELNRAPDCTEPLPELKPSQDHTILFRPHLKTSVPPRPFPDEYQDKWDSYHVRMPCSPENLYPVEDQSGQKKVQSRWELIESALLSGIKNSLDLEEAILTYNARYSQRWNFRGMHMFFTEALDADETVYFFDKVLPGMVQLALQLPKICTQAIPLLRRQRTHSVTMSQQQVASLLANAFFCTFPRRNAQQKRSEYSKFPDINFNRLFEGGKGNMNHRKVEKLKCIINYFRRVTAKMPTGTLTFRRQALSEVPHWDKSTTTLTQLHMTSNGTIETEGHGMLQMDFANKYIGGGVLGYGCVQEEIRFMICPELIVSRLVTEALDDNECLLIKGAEQYSTYSGYANSFKWTGDFRDTTPRDSWGRKETEIVAIDARVIHRYEDQFGPECLRRELNKAFCGFYGNQTAPEHLPAVATGNWGCGAFGGDTRVKGLLQIMAAAEAGRDLAYFTFGDHKLCDDLSSMHEFLMSQSVTVGDLWRNLHRYRTDVLRRSKSATKLKLFPYLYQLYMDLDSDTDEYEDNENTVTELTLVDDQKQSMSPDYKVDTP